MESRALPQGWAWASIDDLVGLHGLFRDGDWVESKDQDPNGSIRLIQLADIGDGEFRDKSARFLVPEKASELGCSFLQEGDLLIARMPDPLGRACIFPLKGQQKFVTVVDVCIVRFGHSHIDNKYLLHAINSPVSRKRISDFQTGSTRKRISRGNLSTIEFPIAPLAEQQRIVAKIEELFSELDQGVASLKTAREQLKVYRQSLLKSAFEGKLTAEWRAAHSDQLETAEALQQRIARERSERYRQQLADWDIQGKAGPKPKAPKPLAPLTAEELAELPELPEEWAWLPLGTACFESVLGKMLDKEKNRGKLKPYLRNVNVRWGNFDLDGLLEMRFEKSEFYRYSLVDGDLVVCEGGEPGRCAVWKKTLAAQMYVQKALHRVRFTQSIDPNYVQLYFEFASANRRLEQLFTGTTIKHLTGEKLAQVALPLCHPLEQTELLSVLEAKLSEADQLDQTLATALQQAEALRQSILKKAFSGQLVPQDENDEPATVLLERIRTSKGEQKARRPLASGALELTPPPGQVIPFPVKVPGIACKDLHAGILALAYRLHELNPERLQHFGHVKAEKISHLVEAHLGLDLERQPFKDAAGPNDHPHLKKVEHRARMANWFDVTRLESGKYVFHPKSGFDRLLEKTRRALGERLGEVEHLLELMLPMKMRQAEILATVYAAWNNLLLLGKTPSDEEIVTEARENWHESKLKIEREKFFRALEWMRDKGLIPVGRGRFVGEKGKV